MKAFVTLLILLIVSCSENQESTLVGDNTDTGNEERVFYMGFTPLLYAATTQAETDVYNLINAQGDLVAHHFQQGIPFNDASTFPNFSNYESNIQNEVNNRVNKTNSDKVIYLALDSLNSARNDLTDFWGTSANMSRPSPWDTRSFDDDEVITSYTNFALELIARFKPKYFNYAPEVSDLMINDASKFVEFKVFARRVYQNIKAYYPNLKLMVSIALKEPGSTKMNTATTGFTDIKDYVDIVGISTYGYAFYGHSNAGDPANLPTNWLSQIQTIAPDKSYAIVETAWVAENLDVSAYSLNITSSETYQNEYLSKLFTEANSLNMEAVIWFSSYDYDTLWRDTLGSDSLSKIWKDSGLLDENLSERSGLATWKSWFSRSKK